MEKIKAIALLIASTIIWVGVIVGSAAVLKGTEYKENVTGILCIGVIVHALLLHMMLIWTGKDKLEKGKASIKHGLTIILSAIIWGAVIIGTSTVLKGTPFKDEIRNIISGATTAHLLFIWAPIGIIFKKEKKQIEQENQE